MLVWEEFAKRAPPRNTKNDSCGRWRATGAITYRNVICSSGLFSYLKENNHVFIFVSQLKMERTTDTQTVGLW